MQICTRYNCGAFQSEGIKCWVLFTEDQGLGWLHPDLWKIAAFFHSDGRHTGKFKIPFPSQVLSNRANEMADAEEDLVVLVTFLNSFEAFCSMSSLINQLLTQTPISYFCQVMALTCSSPNTSMINFSQLSIYLIYYTYSLSTIIYIIF